MKKFLYTLMVGALLFVGCTNDMVDDVPTPKAGAKFVVDEFPLFDDSSRATVGTPDAGKSAWEEGDELLLTTTDPVLSTTLTRSANGEWVAAESLSLTPSTVITVTYAPECELVDGVITPKGEKFGTGEYFSTVATYADEVVTISFKGVERNYSRLRLAAGPGKELSVAVNKFTPAGSTSTIDDNTIYNITTDEKGNAYLYGLFGEGGIISVANGDTYTERTLNSGTVAGQSYALDSRSRFYLTFGHDFNSTLLLNYINEGSFTKFKFVVNSESKLGDAYNGLNGGYKEAYFFANGDTLELHTSCDVFVANEDCSLMFAGCESLTSIDLSGFDTSNVTTMIEMFSNCLNLVKLDLSGFDTSKVTTMRDMFFNCENLVELNISGFDTSNVTDMAGMFFYCEKLTELDLSGFKTSKVTNMGGMFQGCGSLTELDLSGFDTSKVENMNGMFYCCYDLSILDISGFDTSKVDNMGSMFGGCRSLTELDLTSFDFVAELNCNNMFNEFASNVDVENKPAQIYLSQTGYDFLTAKFGTPSDSDNYKFVVKLD